MTNIIEFPVTPRPIKTKCDVCHEERELFPYEPDAGADAAGHSGVEIKWFCGPCFEGTLYFDGTMS